MKIIRRKKETGPQILLNINSSGVEVMWYVGPNDKCNNFLNG